MKKQQDQPPALGGLMLDQKLNSFGGFSYRGTHAAKHLFESYFNLVSKRLRGNFVAEIGRNDKRANQL